MSIDIYNNMIPFFVVAGVLGMGFLAYTFYRMNRPIIAGMVLGLSTGLVGPFIFMAPLQSCTFEPEQETLSYHIGIALFFLGAGLALAMVRGLTQFVLDRGSLLATDTTQGAFRAPWVVPLAILSPTLIILAVFLYYPAIETFRLSTLLTRIGAPNSAFRCVSNFTTLMEPGFVTGFWISLAATLVLAAATFILRRQEPVRSDLIGPISTLFGLAALALVYFTLMSLWDEDYGGIFFNTIFISSMIVILGLIIALAIAYLVFQPVKGASIYRTLLIWPYAISPPIAGILFFVMFDPTAGIFDHLSNTFLGAELPNYREDEWLARWVVILASVWKTLGYNILFYLAGLQNVPKELLEAASIDGANVWQRFRNVVIPALSPITFFLIITNLTYAFFETYGTIDYLTRGAPAGATSVAIYELIEVGITQKRLGQGAAHSVILFAMVIAVTVWQFRTSGSRVNYGA